MLVSLLIVLAILVQQLVLAGSHLLAVFYALVVWFYSHLQRLLRKR